MKNKSNHASEKKAQIRYGASNTLLLIILLLIPFLHRPVSGQHGSVRIIFEKQRTGTQDTPPLSIDVTIQDKVAVGGYVTMLLLLFSYIRRREMKPAPEDKEVAGMVMEDEEVLAAWKQVRRLLSDDDET